MISSLCYKGLFKTIFYADDCKKAILNWTPTIFVKINNHLIKNNTPTKGDGWGILMQQQKWLKK